MSGWKEWAIGEVVEAGDLQTYIQNQTVQKYASSTARNTALGTAVAEGMVSYLEDTNAVEAYDGSAWVAVGNDLTTGTEGYTALSAGTAGLTYQPVSHNYIINGAFDVWQRGTSFSFPLTDGYIADRWTVPSSTTRTRTVTKEALTLAEQEQTGCTYFLKFDSTGQSLFDNRIITPIEGIALAGKEVTFSYWAKSSLSSATTSLQARVYIDSSTYNSVSVSTSDITSTWTRYSATFTMPSAPSGTQTDSARITLFFTHQNVAQEFYITGAQLEAGSVATPFKRNAPNLQGELAACQRYYWQTPQILNYAFGTSANFSTTQSVTSINYPTTMRAAPTVALQGAASDIYLFQSGGFYNGTAISFSGISPTSNRVVLTVASGLTNGYASMMAIDVDVPYLTFTAEL